MLYCIVVFTAQTLRWRKNLDPTSYCAFFIDTLISPFLIQIIPSEAKWMVATLDWCILVFHSFAQRTVVVTLYRGSKGCTKQTAQMLSVLRLWGVNDICSSVWRMNVLSDLLQFNRAPPSSPPTLKCLLNSGFYRCSSWARKFPASGTIFFYTCWHRVNTRAINLSQPVTFTWDILSQISSAVKLLASRPEVWLWSMSLQSILKFSLLCRGSHGLITSFSWSYVHIISALDAGQEAWT